MAAKVDTSSHIPREGEALLSYLKGVDAEGEDAIKERAVQWDKAIQFFHKGATEDQSSDIFSANIIAPAIRRKAAFLTETKPRLDIQARREGLEVTSKMLREATNAVWDEQNVGITLERTVLIAEVMQSAFWEIGWDSEADYGMGNIALFLHDPRNILVDPAVRQAADMDFAQYVRTRTVVPVSALIRRYGREKAAQVKTTGKVAAEEKDSGRSGAVVVRSPIQALLRETGADAGKRAAVPRAELFTYWLADPAEGGDGPLYPGGRVIVRAGDIILSDAPNPYYDGRWPFEWLDNNPDLNSPWGRDEIDAVKKIQYAFNRMGNLAVRASILEGIPFIVADNNALDTATIQALRDMGFYVMTRVVGRQVDRPASTLQPQSLLSMMSAFQALSENLIGLADGGASMPAKGRMEVRSNPQLEGIQKANQVLIRAQARRMEAFLERAGQKIISRIIQFYTSDRVLSIVGAQGSAQQGKVTPYKFEREKLTAETFKIATERYQEQMRQQREKEEAERREAIEDGAGAMSLTRGSNVIPLDIPPSDVLLAAIKGVWRDLRFIVEPFSSLSDSRVARMQMKEHFAASGNLPWSDVLEEAGVQDPMSKLEQATQEMLKKKMLGLEPTAAPGAAKGGKKK